MTLPLPGVSPLTTPIGYAVRLSTFGSVRSRLISTEAQLLTEQTDKDKSHLCLCLSSPTTTNTIHSVN